MFFYENSCFFRHRFLHRFLDAFLMEKGSKIYLKNSGGGNLFRSFSASFFGYRFWDAFWSPFGSLWAPFGLPLATLGSLLGPFWLPLAPFWLPLGPFGLHFLISVDFGALLALFDSLLPPFRLLFLIFNTF